MKRLLTAIGLLVPLAAVAHPLGNFSTNRHAALLVAPDAVRVAYSLDLAELPTHRELRRLDTNGDGTSDPAERDAYATREARAIAANLDLGLDGAPLALTPVRTSLEISPGAGGLSTLRLDVTYEAAVPRPAGDLTFADRNFAGRPGWREVIATPAGGVTLTESSVPERDVSHALRAYPDDMLRAPLRVSEARMRLSAGAAITSRASPPLGSRNGAERFGDRFTALLTDPAPLGAWTILTSLLAAAMLGAFHALTPGHGKTVVGAYLVGSRGTAWHAIFLGLVVTLTHTLGVYVLGLGTLAASAWVIPERLHPWISLVSGLLVIAVGASMATSRRRAAHHHGDGHGHSHLPPPGTTVSLRGLLALGVSGGLVPCPSALVVMLGAIAVHRIAFGLALIAAFSVGLAGVLTGIGLMLVYARSVFDVVPLDGRLARYVPVASAVVISFAGAAIVVEALWQMRMSFS